LAEGVRVPLVIADLVAAASISPGGARVDFVTVVIWVGHNLDKLMGKDIRQVVGVDGRRVGVGLGGRNARGRDPNAGVVALEVEASGASHAGQDAGGRGDHVDRVVVAGQPALSNRVLDNAVNAAAAMRRK